MKKILLGINTLTSVTQQAYLNHMMLSYELGRYYKKWQFGICAPPRMAIDNMRNFCAKVAIEQGFEYIWFIDDDVLLEDPKYSLQTLLDLNVDIASGITLIRTYPYAPMLFSFDKKRKSPYLYDYQKRWDKDKVIRNPTLGAVGFSCCLLKVRALSKVDPPYFLTGPNFTEDVFYCQRAAAFNPRLTLAASGKVMTHHILGNQTISPSNRTPMLQYDKALGLRRTKLKKEKQTEINIKLTTAKGTILAGMYAPKGGGVSNPQYEDLLKPNMDAKQGSMK